MNIKQNEKSTCIYSGISFETILLILMHVKDMARLIEHTNGSLYVVPLMAALVIFNLLMNIGMQQLIKLA